MNEAHVLFSATILLSGFLIFQVLEAGLLGSVSVWYAVFFGRESKDLQMLKRTKEAQCATVILKSPVFPTVEKEAFEALLDAVPIDDDTGESIIEGPIYLNWVKNMKKQLLKRTVETITAFRQNEYYYRDTFCKMTQGLASQRAWKEAQETQDGYNREFQDIGEWAARLKPNWEQSIFKEAQREAEDLFRKEHQAAALEAKRQHEENEKRLKESSLMQKQVLDKRSEEEAKRMEAELLREAEEEERAVASKKRGGKRG